MVSSGGAGDSLTDKLSIKTPLFTISSYVTIGTILMLLFIIFILITLCFLRRKNIRKNRTRTHKHLSSLIPVVSEEIAPVKPNPDPKIEFRTLLEDKTAPLERGGGQQGGRNMSVDSEVSLASTSGSGGGGEGGVGRNIGWGRWYALRELEEATGGFGEVNVIGEGGYGVVYRGVLPDGSLVAVKNLMNNKLSLENLSSL